MKNTLLSFLKLGWRPRLKTIIKGSQEKTAEPLTTNMERWLTLSKVLSSETLLPGSLFRLLRITCIERQFTDMTCQKLIFSLFVRETTTLSEKSTIFLPLDNCCHCS